jgi:hypothetical protein
MGRWLRGEPVQTGGRGRNGRTYRFRNGGLYELRPGVVIEVRPSFGFDLSAPWWIVWALPQRRMLRAAALHDWCRRDRAFSLWFGNLMFLDALRADGVREPVLTLAWLAVRTNRKR